MLLRIAYQSNGFEKLGTCFRKLFRAVQEDSGSGHDIAFIACPVHNIYLIAEGIYGLGVRWGAWQLAIVKNTAGSQLIQVDFTADTIPAALIGDTRQCEGGRKSVQPGIAHKDLNIITSQISISICESKGDTQGVFICKPLTHSVFV